MKRYRRLTECAMLKAELPAESLPRQTLLELIDNHRILLENHSGVISYDSCEIRVRVGFGILSIRGTELLLANMTCRQLIITGRIDDILILRGDRV